MPSKADRGPLTAIRAATCALLLVGFAAGGCSAQRDRWDYHAPDLAHDGAPPDLAAIETLQGAPLSASADKSASEQMSKMREEAFAFGAQAGLAHRSHEIGLILDRHAAALDKLWDFQALVIQVPRGDGVIVPPVVEKTENDLRVSGDGLSAAAATQVLKIISPARVSSIAANWRDYLRRTFPDPKAPTGLLLPRNDEERAIWKASVDEGWGKGVRQADETFKTDLARLVRDFDGEVRYVGMVRSGEVSEIYISHVDLGVTGGDKEMRIGERLVRISEPARLRNGQWQPVALHPVDPGAPISNQPEIDARLAAPAGNH